MLYKSSLVSLFGALSLAVAKSSSEDPSPEQIAKDRATVKPESPVSNVPGLSFNRFVNIWLENTDYESAKKNLDLNNLAKQGLTLNNFWALTHPSQPNYCASAGGDSFGMDHDEFVEVPANVSTIADLFDTKGIAWGEYQEHLPYAGYQGFEYSETDASDYVRKHNPLVMFDSVTENDTRLRQIKNFTSFYDDLNNQKLPQHMFITPNMTNDAHDTNITFAGAWTYRFLSDLLQNEYFTKDTLIMLTFDENDTYEIGNKIYTFLLGGAVPENLRGAKDDTFYTHYSVISSMSANWDLPSLGRWDCGANLFSWVAEKTGYTNWEVETEGLYLNQTYPGPLSENEYSEYSPNWPVPLTSGTCSGGSDILDTVKKTYEGREATYEYTSPIPFDAASGNNVGIKYHRNEDGQETERTTGSHIPNGETEDNLNVENTVKPCHDFFETPAGKSMPMTCLRSRE